MPKKLIDSKINYDDILNDVNIPIQQKRYILEASLELLEYSFAKNDMGKKEFLQLFYDISHSRAKLGLGKKLDIKTPSNPLNSHRAVKLSTGLGFKDGKEIGYLGFRPAYHDLEDSNYGFLRGTQIEFLNLELSYSDDSVEVQKATILSIVSLAQRSEFIKAFSWRMKLGFDRDSLQEDTNLIASLGTGLSWGNELGFIYFMVDPLLYNTTKVSTAIGGSVGLIVDRYAFMNTNIELTDRYYDNGEKQLLIKASQSFRISQNTQLQFKYDYKDSVQTYKAMFNYYF